MIQAQVSRNNLSRPSQFMSNNAESKMNEDRKVNSSLKILINSG